MSHHATAWCPRAEVYHESRERDHVAQLGSDCALTGLRVPCARIGIVDLSIQLSDTVPQFGS
jgi:hypothetical protein